MLVIRRHSGDAISVGDEVEIEIIECGVNRVKLGIRAPQHISVLRREVKLTRDQNLAAAQSMAGAALPDILSPYAGGKPS
jgi:carbon storage regulator